MTTNTLKPLQMVKGLAAAPTLRDDSWEYRDKWPSDHPDYVFIGRAVLAIGRLLFDDAWNDKDPIGGHALKPLPPMEEASDRIRADVAMHWPRTRPEFRRGEFYNWNKGEPVPELTGEEWKQAIDNRLARIAAGTDSWMRWSKAIGVLAAALRSGRLATATGYIQGAGFWEVRDVTEFWHVADAALGRRFRTLRANPSNPTDEHSSRRGWIFFGAASFASFERELRWQLGKVPTTSEPFEFDLEADYFRLHEALAWVATDGQDATSGIAATDLLEVGARKLFARLARPEAPLAEGMVEMIYEPVDRRYWEMARLEPGDGHHVLLYPAREAFEADLIPYRATSPRWQRIRIAREDLLELFPAKTAGRSGALEKNLPEHCRAFRTFLDAAVRASPYKRTLEKAKDIDPWRAINAPSLTDRRYKAIRAEVLANYRNHGWGQTA